MQDPRPHPDDDGDDDGDTGLVPFARHYLLALQFFTRIPVTGRLAAWVGFSPALLRRAAGHFPGVGWLVGLVAASVYGLLLVALPGSLFAPLVAAVLCIVATVLLTGAFHEDGLADLADGLGGSSDRERALEIMKDSRIGAFGALALMLALLTKVSLLAMLGDSTLTGEDAARACVVLWLGHVLSRGAPLVLIALLPHVGDTATSKSKPLADRLDADARWTALAWCAGACIVALLVLDVGTLVVALVFCAAALVLMGRWLVRRLQGFTGDALGATQQVCELAFLFGAALMT